MKKTVFILAILSLFFSCDKPKVENKIAQVPSKPEVIVLQDSILSLINSYMVQEDSTTLTKALLLSDEVLRIDPTEIKNEKSNNQRVTILKLQNKKKEAFTLMGELIPNDINNLDRLIYNGLSYKIGNKIDSSNYYFFLATELCDKRLSVNKDDVDASLNKFTIYLYQEKIEEAKKHIDSQLKVDSLNGLWIDYKANLDKIAIETRKFFEMDNN